MSGLKDWSLGQKLQDKNNSGKTRGNQLDPSFKPLNQLTNRRQIQSKAEALEHSTSCARHGGGYICFVLCLYFCWVYVLHFFNTFFILVLYFAGYILRPCFCPSVLSCTLYVPCCLFGFSVCPSVLPSFLRSCRPSFLPSFVLHSASHSVVASFRPSPHASHHAFPFFPVCPQGFSCFLCFRPSSLDPSCLASFFSIFRIA